MRKRSTRRFTPRSALLSAALLGLTVVSFGTYACRGGEYAEPVPQAPATAEIPSPYKRTVGPYAVGDIETFDLLDAERDTMLPVRILYPKDAAGADRPRGAPFPLVVFSHGAAHSKDGVRGITSHWVSHGYVCIMPSHADSLARQREYGERARLIPTVKRVTADALAGIDRVRDLRLVLDSLDAIVAANPQLSGLIDRDRLGVAGHSLGALTAVLAGGATVDLPSGEHGVSVRIADFDAVLFLSGQGPGIMGLTEDSWDGVNVPMMSFSGSRDRGLKGHPVSWRKEAFERAPAGDKFHVFIEGANHVSYIGKPGDNGGDLPIRPLKRRAVQIFRDVCSASTAFWDAYLKDDTKARAYLASEALLAESDGRATLFRR